MTTLIITWLVGTGTFIFAVGILAIALAHWRDRRIMRDFDGMEFEEPPKQHPIWRDDP